MSTSISWHQKFTKEEEEVMTKLSNFSVVKEIRKRCVWFNIQKPNLNNKNNVVKKNEKTNKKHKFNVIKFEKLTLSKDLM